MLTQNDLHHYQHKAINFIKSKPKCALFLEMGLGKTVSTLTAISQIPEATKVLIIAPKRVALTTWPKEIGSWQHLQDLSYTVILGTPEQRGRKLNENARTHIISRDNICWLVDYFGVDWPYNVIVLDESASVKNPASKRFKALRKVAPLTERIVLLTGTPASNGLLDLWSQLYLIDGGKRLGKTYDQFKLRYFSSDYHGYTWTPYNYSQAAITSKIADVCLSMQAEDYLKLPKMIYRVYRFALNKSTRKKYDAFKRQFFLEFGDKELTVVNAAVLVNKLIQFCNGAVYLEDKSYEVLHDDKLNILEDLVESANGEPLLVAYHYQSDKERILKRFPEAVALNADNIAEWNRREIPLMLAHPASCGHGLNLQQGGHHLVWFGLNWSLEHYQQMNARLYRQGQQQAVIVHHIVAEDSADELVMQALKDKDFTQNAIIEALKIS